MSSVIAESSSKVHDAGNVPFDRVLDAEKAAERRLEEARRSARAIVAAARAREEAIGKRTDERLSRLHSAMRRRIDAEIARQREEFDAAYRSDGSPRIVVETAALRRAVDRLAARLTGYDDEDPG